MESKKTGRIVGVLILIAYVVIGSFIFESAVISMLLELITGIAVIGMAILMFSILKPIDKNLTYGYVTIKTIDGLLIIIAGFMILFSVTDIHELIHSNSIYLFGTGFLILSYLFYKSRLVPRFLSVWGIIASALVLVSSLINVALSPAIPFFISHLPIIANELFLAVWLIVKGFSPIAIVPGSVKKRIREGVG